MVRNDMARDISLRDILERGVLTSGLLPHGGTAVSESVAAERHEGAMRSGRYQLGGTATLVEESGVPPADSVLRIDTSNDGLEGSAYRYLATQASGLTGAIHFDYYVESGDCGGGSPRVALGVDIDGDGTVEGYLHGLVDPKSRGCPEAQTNWVHVDLTDGAHRWVTGGLGLELPFVAPWNRVVSNLGSHEILTGILVDDSYWSANVAGVTYYGNVTIGERTLDGATDVVEQQ